MKTLVLAAAALALCAGAAQAGPKATAHATTHLSPLVGPGQPLPYAKLNAYSKASTKARADTDWWSAGAFAAAGASANASTSASGVPIDSPAPAAANPGISSSQPAGAAASATVPPSATSASAPSPR